MCDLERFQNCLCARLLLALIEFREPVSDVAFRREMREQRKILEDVADSAIYDRDAEAVVGIEQDAIPNGNTARLRTAQSGYAIQQRGFACTRGSKNDGKTCGSLEGDIETGRVICEEGKFADEFFVILEGRAEVREAGRKRGTLKSGSSGRKVKSRKQAIAIGLSKARKKGSRVPRKRGG